MEKAATFTASYGLLAAADCILVGSDVKTLPCGVVQELFIQPVQWSDGM